MGEGTSALPSAAHYVRPKATQRQVIWVDRLADLLIRLGGLAVIFAVFAIMAFLVQGGVPLFRGGSVEESVRYALPSPPGDRLLALASDEHQTLGLAVHASGRLEAFHVPSGRLVSAWALPLEGKRVTAFARTPVEGHVALGFADGSVRFGRL